MGLGNSASLAKASMSQPCDAVCNKKEKHFFVWFSELFFLANSMGKVKLLADREERDAGSIHNSGSPIVPSALRSGRSPVPGKT